MNIQGATKSDVKFLKGVAPVLSPDDNLWIYDTYTYENGGMQWQYGYRVQFEKGKVWLVSGEYTPRPRANTRTLHAAALLAGSINSISC